MYEILKLNAISPVGLAKLPKEEFKVSDGGIGKRDWREILFQTEELEQKIRQAPMIIGTSITSRKKGRCKQRPQGWSKN